MEENIFTKTSELSKQLDIYIPRKKISLNDNQPHDESYSYTLCVKYYNKKDELLSLITSVENILRNILWDYPKQVNYISDLYSLLGNMYYVKGDFSNAAGHFMRALSYSKDDITVWYEFLFALRSLGEIEIFEKCIFNFEKVYSLWKYDPDIDFNREKVEEILEKLKTGDIKMKRRHQLGKIEIIRRCNQDCPFCSVEMTGEKMPIIEIKKKMRELKSKGITEIMFSGGEPTFRKELPLLIKYANILRFNEICIQTNGMRLHDENYLRSLLTAGATMIKFDVSFHSYDRKIYNKLIGERGSFDFFIKGLENIKKHNIPIFTTTVINSLNYRLLIEHIKYCEKNFPNIKHFSFNFIDPIVQASKNKWLIPKYSEATPYMHDAFRYILEIEKSFRIEFVPLCFLQGFEEFSSESRRRRFNEKYLSVFLEEGDNNNIINVSTQGFKAPQCRYCVLNNKCPGINQNYIKVHGYEEFIPVKV